MSRNLIYQLSLSPHAKMRMIERDFRSEDVEFILRYGSHRQVSRGRYKVRIRPGDLPNWYSDAFISQRVANLVAILDPTKSVVVTVYTNHLVC